MITEEKIRKMKHALRIMNFKSINGVFFYSRNFFASDQDKDWEELFKEGYATKSRDPFNEDKYVYRVTPSGLHMLEQIIGVQIKPEEE